MCIVVVSVSVPVWCVSGCDLGSLNAYCPELCFVCIVCCFDLCYCVCLSYFVFVLNVCVCMVCCGV